MVGFIAVVVVAVGALHNAGGDLVGDGGLKGATILGGWIGGKGLVADGNHVDFFFCKLQEKRFEVVRSG